MKGAQSFTPAVDCWASTSTASDGFSLGMTHTAEGAHTACSRTGSPDWQLSQRNAFPALWNISSELFWQLNEAHWEMGRSREPAGCAGQGRGCQVPAALAHAAPLVPNLMKRRPGWTVTRNLDQACAWGNARKQHKQAHSPRSTLSPAMPLLLCHPVPPCLQFLNFRVLHTMVSWVGKYPAHTNKRRTNWWETLFHLQLISSQVSALGLTHAAEKAARLQLKPWLWAQKVRHYACCSKQN